MTLKTQITLGNAQLSLTLAVALAAIAPAVDAVPGPHPGRLDTDPVVPDAQARALALVCRELALAGPRLQQRLDALMTLAAEEQHAFAHGDINHDLSEWIDTYLGTGTALAPVPLERFARLV